MTSDQYPYTNYMTLEEWKRFVKNFNNYFASTSASIKHHMIRSTSFFTLINSAFSWRHTPEGHTYWDRISKRTKPLK